MAELDYGPPRDDEEAAAYRRILVRCFDMEPERGERWLANAGVENVRLLRRDGRVAAGLLLVDMGQHFGGRRVPMVGIAGVGVPPEERGAGVATRLMQAAVDDVRAAGRPLSALYPATLPLYRRAGYELAGTRLLVRADPASFPRGGRELALRPIEDADRPRVEELYEEHARTRPGYLSRGRYVWQRVRTTRDGPTEGYLVERGDRVDGYVYLARVKGASPGYDLALTDLVARDAEAGRRLLALLGDHRSMAREVRWYEGPAGPLLSLLSERGHRTEVDFTWMLRLVDLAGALAARGYAPGLEAELHLDVADEQMPRNAGRSVLRVSDGRGALEPGGRGELALSVGALAALYSGFQSAEAIAQSGRARGTAEVLRLATAIFAGPAPGMPDMF